MATGANSSTGLPEFSAAKLASEQGNSFNNDFRRRRGSSTSCAWGFDHDVDEVPLLPSETYACPGPGFKLWSRRSCIESHFWVPRLFELFCNSFELATYELLFRTVLLGRTHFMHAKLLLQLLLRAHQTPPNPATLNR